MKTFTLFHCLLLTLTFVGVFSQLKILSPPKLKEWWDSNPGSTKTSLALFGKNPWGRKLIGRLQLADPLDACDYIRQKDNDTKSSSQNSIMVAIRGNCPYIVKAKYAQLAGAKMLLIADNKIENVEGHLMVENLGQGDTVVIPTALVAKEGADRLINSLNSTNASISTINVIYDFTLEKSKSVEYHVWISSVSVRSFQFASAWKAYEQKLSSSAKMVPHYVHLKGSYSEPFASSNDCICGGRYCAPDPDAQRDNNGGKVIMENLRQKCIMKEYSMDAWWEYMSKYDAFCLSSGDMDYCSRNTILDMGLDYKHIESCVNRSFDTPDLKNCKSNRMLDAEESDMLKDGLVFYPSIIINGFTYRGNLVPAEGVFEAICASFSKLPSVCKQFSEETPIQGGGGYTVVLASAFMFLLLFTMFVFCCYRRYLKRDMYKQMVRDVNIAVSQYIAIQDSPDSDDRHDRT